MLCFCFAIQNSPMTHPYKETSTKHNIKQITTRNQQDSKLFDDKVHSIVLFAIIVRYSFMV